MNSIAQRGRSVVLAAVIAATFLAAPAALAADVADIGFVDQAALSALPSFQAANRQLADYSHSLQGQYIGRAKHASQRAQAQLVQEFQGKVSDKQRQLFGPLFSRAQVAIASVASSKSLSVVVDKRIVVFGGQDITSSVRDLLNSPGDPVPPASTPPPSTVGFVDQSAIDSVPRIKAVQDDFNKFKTDQDKSAANKMKAAKNDTDRNTVIKDYQKAIDDKTNAVVKPMVDQTRSAISGVAKKKGLTLVVDRSNIIYGGQDITSDVTAALK